MKSKKEQIAEWIARGPEWLAGKLYEEKLLTKRLAKRRYRSRPTYYEEVAALEKANETMAQVLEDNGIRPTHLTVQFIEADCENCEFKGDEDDDEPNYDCYYTRIDGECPYRKDVISRGFYSYVVSDGLFEGITSIFTKERFEAVKVINDRTGEVVYEFSQNKRDEAADGA